MLVVGYIVEELEGEAYTYFIYMCSYQQTVVIPLAPSKSVAVFVKGYTWDDGDGG